MLDFKSFKLAIFATPIVSVALTGCATTQEQPLSEKPLSGKPPSVNTEKPLWLNTENVMKIHSGMDSSKILEMFGTPKNVRQSVCGGAVGRPWTCTTWEYGDPPFEWASFTFSGGSGSLILNNYEVNRK
jgi:hypothetical protein